MSTPHIYVTLARDRYSIRKDGIELLAVGTQAVAVAWVTILNGGYAFGVDRVPMLVPEYIEKDGVVLPSPRPPTPV